MTAYMDLNGVPASASRWLFTEVLRETWGFDGFVVSDANAVRNLVTHGFAADLSGCRSPCRHRRRGHGDGDRGRRVRASARGAASGAVDEDVIDASVRRILEAKLRLGLFDDPYVDEDRAREVLADPAHREVARIAAERSAVLLRNEGEPAAAGRRTSSASLAVIGPLADSRRDTLGPWVFDFDLDETVTVLDGIRRAVGDRVRGRLRARHPRRSSACSPRCSTCAAATAPADPEGFDDGRRVRPRGGARRGRRCRGRRRRRMAEHDRRGRRPGPRWSCPGGSSSCCRPSWRPALRPCCW